MKLKKINMKSILAAFLLCMVASLVPGAEIQRDNFDYIHHDHDAMLKILKEVNEKCPDITRLYNLTETSVEGRELVVMEMTEDPGKHIPSKSFILIVHFVAHASQQMLRRQQCLGHRYHMKRLV